MRIITIFYAYLVYTIFFGIFVWAEHDFHDSIELGYDIFSVCVFLAPLNTLYLLFVDIGKVYENIMRSPFLILTECILCVSLCALFAQFTDNRIWFHATFRLMVVYSILTILMMVYTCFTTRNHDRYGALIIYHLTYIGILVLSTLYIYVCLFFQGNDKETFEKCNGLSFLFIGYILFDAFFSWLFHCVQAFMSQRIFSKGDTFLSWFLYNISPFLQMLQLQNTPLIFWNTIEFLLCIFFVLAYKIVFPDSSSNYISVFLPVLIPKICMLIYKLHLPYMKDQET